MAASLLLEAGTSIIFNDSSRGLKSRVSTEWGPAAEVHALGGLAKDERGLESHLGMRGASSDQPVFKD